MIAEETTTPGPGRVYDVADDRRGKFRLLVSDVHGVHVDGRIVTSRPNRRRAGVNVQPPARPSRKRISVRLDEATFRPVDLETWSEEDLVELAKVVTAENELATAIAIVW